jgi:hypothetical protein
MSFVGDADTGQSAVDRIQELPESLDSLYPPNTPRPAYLLAMFDLAKPFSGIVCDLFEEDMENAQANLEHFKQRYVEISKMIPEWQDDYPLAPVEELAGAMQTGDLQLKYHWGDYSEISVTDPLSGEDVSFPRLMLMIETNLTGIGVDLEQGQKENALKQLQGFDARFQTLKETCAVCHESDRKYFVDESILGMIDDLKLMLSEPTVDSQAAGTLLQGIGMESCHKCHLVHIPSAYAGHQ